jgi:hypothetical protein
MGKKLKNIDFTPIEDDKPKTGKTIDFVPEGEEPLKKKVDGVDSSTIGEPTSPALEYKKSLTQLDELIKGYEQDVTKVRSIEGTLGGIDPSNFTDPSKLKQYNESLSKYNESLENIKGREKEISSYKKTLDEAKVNTKDQNQVDRHNLNVVQYNKMLHDYNLEHQSLKDLEKSLNENNPDTFTDYEKVKQYQGLVGEYNNALAAGNKKYKQIQSLQTLAKDQRDQYLEFNSARQEKLFETLGLDDKKIQEIRNEVFKQNNPDKAKLVDQGVLIPMDIDVDTDDLSKLLTGQSYDQIMRTKAIQDNKDITDRIFGSFGKAVTKTLGFELPASTGATISNILADLKIKPEDENRPWYKPGVVSQFKKAVSQIPGAKETVNEHVDNARVAVFDWAQEWRKAPIHMVPGMNGVPMLIANDKNLIQSISQIKKPLDVIDFVFSSVGQGAAQIIPSIYSRGTTSYLQEVGNNYLDGVTEIANQNKMTPEEVIRKDMDEPVIARNFGIIQGALDSVGAGKVAGSIGIKGFRRDLRDRALSWIRKSSEAGGVELLTESTQSALQQTAVGKMTGLGTTEAVQNIDWLQAIDEGIAGAIGGAGISAAGQGATALSKANFLNRLKKTSVPEDKQSYENFVDSVADVATKYGDTRPKEEIKKFIEDEVLPKAEEIQAPPAAVTPETKPVEDAIQEQIPAEVPVSEEAGTSAPVGEGVSTESQGPPGESKTEQAKVAPKARVRVEAKPVEDINVDLERFQAREEDYSKESVQKIVDAVMEGKFDVTEFDPVRTWTDPKNDKTYVLAGHSRTEAFRELQKKLEAGEIPEAAMEKMRAQGFENFKTIDAVDASSKSEADAIAFATERSNKAATQETVLDRAKLIAKRRSEGMSESEVKKKLSTTKREVLFSYLKKGGQTRDMIKAVQKSETTEGQGRVMQVGEFIGEARKRFPQLTDSQENELHEYLVNGTGKKLTTRADFIDRLDSVVNNVSFLADPNQPLNLENRTTRGFNESQMVDEYDQVKKEIQALEKERFNKKDPPQPSRLQEIEGQLKNLNNQLVKLTTDIQRAKEGDKQQFGLFTPVAPIGKKTETATDTTPVGAVRRTPEEKIPSDETPPAAVPEEEIKEPDFFAQTSDASKGAAPIGEFEGRAIEPQPIPIKLYRKAIELAKKYNPDATLGQDKTGRGNLGVFYRGSTNVRVKGLNSLSVVMHELTHALDKQNSVVSDFIKNTQAADPFRQQLTNLYLKYYPKAQPGHDLYRRMVEGYATLVQKYLEQPAEIRKDFPELVKEFLEPGGKYYVPQVEEFMKDVDKVIQTYQSLDPLAKMSARIVNESAEDLGETAPFLSKSDQITKTLFDSLYPYEKLAKIHGTHFTQEDVSIFIRLSNNYLQMAQKNISSKAQKFYSMSPTGEFFKKHDFNFYTIVNGLEKRGMLDEFDAYLYGRRIKYDYDEQHRLEAELAKVQAPTYVADIMKSMSISQQQAETFARIQSEQLKKDIADMEALLKKEGVSEKESEEAFTEGNRLFEEEVKMYDKLTRENLDFAVNPLVQMIDDTAYSRLSAKKGYTPLKRAFYDEIVGENDIPKIRQSGKTKASQFMSRRGSEKAIISPLMSSMVAHTEMLNKGMKQMVYNKILGMVEANEKDLAPVFQVVPLEVSEDPRNRYPQEKDPNIIMARKDGKRVPILANAQMKAVLDENYSYHNHHLIEKVGVSMAQVFRAGTTGLFWQFFANNIFLDQAIASVNTRNGMFPFVTSSIEMGKAILSKGSVEAAYLKEYMFLAGTSQTFLSADVASTQNLNDVILGNKKQWTDRLAGFFDFIAKVMSTPGNASEIFTRGTEYIRARKAGKHQAVALEEAGRVSAPFHHTGRLGGKIGQSYVRSLPYFNSSLQVLIQNRNALQTKEGRIRFAVAVFSITAASVGSVLYLLGMDDDDEQKQLIKAIPPETMSKYLFLPNPYSKKRLVQIRIPDQLAWLSSMLNMMLIENAGQTDYKWSEYGQASLSFLPTQANPFAGYQMLFSYLPQAVKPSVEVATGQKTYPTVRPIESQKDLSLPPELRYNKYTSTVAVFMGEKLGWSPKKIDHFLEGTFGRAVKYVTGKEGAYGFGDIFTKELYFEASRQVQFYYEIKKENQQKIKALEEERIEYSQEEADRLYEINDSIGEIEALMQDYSDQVEGEQEAEAIQTRNQIFRSIRELEAIVYL